jgi:peptide subunit release factor 1 (eRF1)
MNTQLLQPLLERAPCASGVLSLYLDMAVNSENKRTHQIFLQQKRGEYSALDSDRPAHHREPIGEALERAERWLDENYQGANRGVALFVELGGEWLSGFQLPVSLENRWIVAERPVIGPLVEVLSAHRRYGVALVDREHCRLAEFRFGALRVDRELRPDAYPTPHDIQKGGWAAKDYQKHKAEEARQFFRLFAAELADVDARLQEPPWVLFGTVENVRHFRDFLPSTVDQRVIHWAHASVDAPEHEIVERLQPFVTEHALQDEASAVDRLRDRLRTHHRAIAGLHDTLEQLQEGKVDTLVIARDFHSNGAQCMRCGFYLDRLTGDCPYCGGALREGVDLGESMIRMATSQEVDLEFVDLRPIAELQGVGALLKFT